MFTVRRLLSNKVARDTTVTICFVLISFFYLSVHAYVRCVLIFNNFQGQRTVYRKAYIIVAYKVAWGLLLSAICICLKTDIVMIEMLYQAFSTVK